MNNDIIQGKWAEIKGEIRNKWGKITGDELEQTKGNLTAIGGLLQKHYGESKENASHKLNEVIESFGDYASKKSEQVKEKMQDPEDAKVRRA